MVHQVVESIFGLRQGFWGRVDGGVDVARINQMANRRGGKDKYEGFGDDLSELYLAEALAGLSWSLRELTPEDRYTEFLRLCKASSLEAPPNVTAEALASVTVRLDELRRQWRALGQKGTIELAF
jgi:hypothetical protein